MTQPQAKECWRPPESRRRKVLPQSLLRACSPAVTLIPAQRTDFRLLHSRTVTAYISVALSHQVHGNWLQQTPLLPSLTSLKTESSHPYGHIHCEACTGRVLCTYSQCHSLTSGFTGKAQSACDTHFGVTARRRD